MFGQTSLRTFTPKELAQLVEGIRFIEKANANSVNKDCFANELEPIRKLFTKSVVASRLPAGTVLQQNHLAVKKPGTGIPASRLTEIIGRRVKYDRS